jgi:hypothetical protein
MPSPFVRRAHVSDVVGALEVIASSADPTYNDPRAIMLELVLAIAELESAQNELRRCYWPRTGGQP